MVLHGDLPNIHVPVYKRMFILNIDVLVLFRFCKKKKITLIGSENWTENAWQAKMMK